MAASATGNSGSSSSGRSDMISAVSQLVTSVSSTLRAQSSSLDPIAVEDMLAQLESTDKNFYSYDLVRNLRGRVERAVGGLVDAHMESGVLVGDGHNAVAKITDQVLSSTEFHQMSQLFVSELRAAVDEMLTDESLLSQPSSQLETSHAPSTSSSTTQYFNLDDSACTSDLLSVHQTGLMFMSHDQLQAITDALHPSQPVQIRVDSLRHLLQFPSGDLVGCDNWSPLNSTIRRTMMEDNKQLSSLCLEFYSRMYSAHMSPTTRCVYVSLGEELLNHLRTHPLSSHSGLDLSDNTNVKLLEMLRLLSHVQRSLPSFWLRYNENVVKAIIVLTMDLLALSYSQSSVIGPAHLFSLLDPKAGWFRKWMHGQYSRVFVLDTLKENSTVLVGVVSHVMSTRAGGLSKSYKGQGSARHKQGGEGGAWLYSERTLSYAHFVHCVCLLERLLLCKEGRGLFPVTLRKGKTKVTVVDLLSHLLSLLYSVSHPVRSTDTQDPLSLSPRLVISHLFEEMAAGNALCRETLCDMKLVSSMIEPLKTASTTSQVSSGEVLVLVGEVLSQLASTENGRQFMLYGGSQPQSLHSEAPVHTIARFVTDSLSSFHHHQSSSVRLLVTWLSVCRHLYSTSYGLLVLESYQLHKHIASAWKKVRGSTSDQFGDMEKSALEESLIDNLLNFAGTPKGVLLLHESGLMFVCTSYMHQRYKLKLQVSKHEKFGYGCMVTQLAATAEGVSALNKCGFLSMLVSELWALLDEGDNDYRLTAPRDHPLDPMDRACHKAVINLLNVFSSFSALVEVFQEPHPSSSSACSPVTVFELLDKLVLVDSEPKKKCLLHFQEAHLFGLRLVSTLVTCLDSLLLLETRYHFLEALLSLQRENKMEDTSDIDSDFVVVDECSIERNRILVSCYFIGGPNERILPPHYLSKASDEYSWPLFSSFPPPSSYQKPAIKQSTSKSQSLLLNHLKSTPTSSGSEEWLDQTRKLFHSELKKNGSLPQEVLSSLLLRVVEALHASEQCRVFSVNTDTLKSDSDCDDPLSAVDELGIEMVLRYGQALSLLPPSHQSKSVTRDITTLMKHVKRFLQSQQQVTAIDSSSNLLRGFDWLTSTVFLLMKGSLKSTLQFVECFSSLVQSSYLWYSRAHCSVQSPADVTCSGVGLTLSTTAHLVDFILQSEVPLVASAIRMSGYAIVQICQHWLRQCFWNFLNWPEICLYLTVCILYGVDYQVYYCVSVLKHLEFRILQHTQEQDLMVFLKEDGLNDYHFLDWISFMEELEKKFRNITLRAMTRVV